MQSLCAPGSIKRDGGGRIKGDAWSCDGGRGARMHQLICKHPIKARLRNQEGPKQHPISAGQGTSPSPGVREPFSLGLGGTQGGGGTRQYAGWRTHNACRGSGSKPLKAMQSIFIIKLRPTRTSALPGAAAGRCFARGRHNLRPLRRSHLPCSHPPLRLEMQAPASAPSRQPPPHAHRMHPHQACPLLRPQAPRPMPRKRPTGRMTAPAPLYGLPTPLIPSRHKRSWTQA